MGGKMIAWKFLMELNHLCRFQTKEGKRVGDVSNSELKRWCQNKAVHVNGEPVTWDEELDFPISAFVLFPNSEKQRVTLF
jgi:hypothetical protein